MRSLYQTILLWFVLLLGASMAIILFASPMISTRFSPRGGLIDRMNAVFFRQAREAFEQGGASRLSVYLVNIESQLPIKYLLVDARGRDLATGEDHRLLIASATSVFPVKGQFARLYSERGFRFVALARPGDVREGNPLFIVLLTAVIALL